MEELKKEAIKKAYGEYWGLVKHYISHDGWVSRDFLVTDSALNFDYRSYLTHNDTVRPKSLAGIENNNGWTRILEDGSNLPKGYCSCWVMIKGTIIDTTAYFSPVLRSFFDNRIHQYYDKFTHYQIVEAPKTPLY